MSRVSLYQSWHEASFGKEDWDKLDLYHVNSGRNICSGFRHAQAFPVRNGCELLEIAPRRRWAASRTSRKRRRKGKRSMRARSCWRRARKRWATDHPRGPCGTCRRRGWFVPSDDIDFTALAGQTVAVVGAGATAFDNAAMAARGGCGGSASIVPPYPDSSDPALSMADLPGIPASLLRSGTMPGDGASCVPSSNCGKVSLRRRMTAARDFPNFHLHEGSPIGECTRDG